MRWALNYCGNFLVFVSAVIGFVSLMAFASLVSFPEGIESSTVGLLLELKSKIKKKKHDNTILLAEKQIEYNQSFDF